MNIVFEEYRDQELAKKISKKIYHYAKEIGEDLLFMHVCGSHEWTMSHYGLRSLLPNSLEVRAGPGCPVCITPSADIDSAVKLSLEGVTIIAYGDMSRSKGSKGLSVMDTRSMGGNIKSAYSIHDAISHAIRAPDKEFVFFAAGFDTTAPPTAYEILKGLPKNLSFIISYRYMPPLVGAILQSSVLGIDGVINAGHSSTITGMKPYYPYFLETRKPQVFCGFEPIDVLLGILALLKQIRERRPRLENEYTRSVTWEGNIIAQNNLDKVFDLDDGYVRGVAVIPGSGFVFKDKYKELDAYQRWGLRRKDSNEQFVHGARCGEVILGLCDPPECPLYMKECTTQNPQGPTMISFEGSCRIWAEHRLIQSINCKISNSKKYFDASITTTTSPS